MAWLCLGCFTGQVECVDFKPHLGGGVDCVTLAAVFHTKEATSTVLAWDRQLGCWHCDGDADELEITECRQAILDVLEELGRAGVVDIAKAVGRNIGFLGFLVSERVNYG